MNATLIRNHNERVQPNDTVFFLGDFCFTNTKGGKDGECALDKAEHYIRQLNGRFVFIKGNHDHNNSLKTCINGMSITLGGKDIYLTHRPQDYNSKFKLNFVGHVHELWKTKKLKKGVLLVNVGCDVNFFKPININEILKTVQDYENGRIDEHGKLKV